MTQLFFLAADVPLTKHFRLEADGSYTKTPYPFARDFTSYSERVNSIDEFHAAIVKHADLGRCLLKGQLLRALDDEPRAGSTSPHVSTNWICFDIDGLPVASVDEFVANTLPPEFHDVSYVVQYSASHGIDCTDLRAHLFFLLSREWSPEVLKLWLTQVNLEKFPQLCEATASYVSLKFPLDRTVAQNDKLLFIAPPGCEGFEDPLGGQRISVAHRSSERVEYRFDASAAITENLMAVRLNECRRAAGLPPKKAKHTHEGEHWICTNPDRATITSERHARGFVYVNLNGGDSYAYWYPEQNPKLLHSFKGEPSYRIEQIDPAYYARITRGEDREEGAPVPMAFREMETDTIYNLVWYPVSQKAEGPYATTHGQKLTHFFAQYGAEPPDVIEDWELIFDPSNETIVDPDKKYCNRFVPTDFMRDASKIEDAFIPTVIDKILNSITGGDPLVKDHFMNWLAFIFQRREKTMTAWVFHGVPGTGKGVFFDKVLRPVFGENYCSQKVLKHLEDQFNADLERNLIFVLDEVRIHDERQSKQKLAQLKNMITERNQILRAMRSNPKPVRNYSNLMFFSNDVDAITIEEGDRRFNVAPRQTTKLFLSVEDVARIEHELPTFANFLASYDVSELRAYTVLENDAKHALRHSSENAFDQICSALRDGNLAFFMEYSRVQSPQIDLMPRYRSLLINWARNVGDPIQIPLGDISTVLDVIAPQNKMKAHQLTRTLESRNLQIHGDESGTDRVIDMTWHGDDLQKQRWLGGLEPAPRTTTVTQLRATH
jgi:hypothetical protein